MILPQSVFPDQIRLQPDLDKFNEDFRAGLDVECIVIDLGDTLAGPGLETLYQARIPAQSRGINR